METLFHVRSGFYSHSFQIQIFANDMTLQSLMFSP